MIHKLKTVNPHFDHVLHGVKTFEIRLDDRNYNVGDTLILLEFVPGDGPGSGFTGFEVVRSISHILTSEDFPQALQPGFVILSFVL